MNLSTAIGRYPAEMALLIGECEALACALGCTMSVVDVLARAGIVSLIATDDFSAQVHRFDVPALDWVGKIIAAEIERQLGDIEADTAQRIESGRCCHDA